MYNKPNRSHLRRSMIVGPTLACVLLATGHSLAQTTREWVGPDGGDWNDPANWNPNGAPAVNDTLVLGFSDQADASIFPFTLNNGGSIYMSDGAVADFDFLNVLENSTVWVTSGSTVTTQKTSLLSSLLGGGVSTVLVTGSGSSWTDGFQFNIGPADNKGAVTVADNAVLSTPDMRLDTGSLTITSGAAVQAGQLLSSAAFDAVSLLVDNATFDVTGDFSFGTEGVGTMTLRNGAHLTTAGNFNRLANNSSGDVTATVDTGAVWDINGTGTLELGGPIGTASLTIGPGGTVNANTGLLLFSPSTLSILGGTLNTTGLTLDGTLNFTDGAINVNGGSFNYSNSLTIDGADAQINLNTSSSAFGPNITVGDAQNGILDVNGSNLDTNILLIGNAKGSVGEVQITNGGANLFFVTVGESGQGTLRVTESYVQASETYIGNASGNDGGLLIVQGSNGVYDNQGFMIVGNGSATGELQVLNHSQVYNEGGFFVGSNGTVVLDDADMELRGEFSGVSIDSAGTVDFRSGRLTLVGGAGQFADGLVVPRDGVLLVDGGLFQTASLDSLVLGLPGSQINASYGQITIGDPASFTGFRTDGVLQVYTETVLTIQSMGFAELGSFTQMFHQFVTPAVLQAPNGLAMGIGDNLVGGGSIQAPFVMAAGSTVSASGDLDIGDAAAPDGFFSDGRLYVNDNIVTLNDANQAVLGSLTTLGNGGMPGTLAVPNGAVIEFGKNITGFGTVDTPNDPFVPLINNGSIAGTSALEPITLTGYVKGVGSLNNVVITGTDAPGFSPATVYRGSVGYAGELEIELGGTTIGNYDRIVHSGLATLGGTLDVLLINGFVPGAGDSFDILDWGSVSGSFSTINLPTLGGSLNWDTSNLLIDGTLSVFSTALDGDLNGDGFVGIADLNIVLGAWNQSVPPGNPLADPSGDGFIGIEDLNTVLGNWNAGTPPADSVVPEPGVATLLLIGSLTLLRRNHASA